MASNQKLTGDELDKLEESLVASPTLEEVVNKLILITTPKVSTEQVDLPEGRKKVVTILGYLSSFALELQDAREYAGTTYRLARHLYVAKGNQRDLSVLLAMLPTIGVLYEKGDDNPSNQMSWQIHKARSPWVWGEERCTLLSKADADSPKTKWPGDYVLDSEQEQRSIFVNDIENDLLNMFKKQKQPELSHSMLVVLPLVNIIAEVLKQDSLVGRDTLTLQYYFRVKRLQTYIETKAIALSNE